jgi:hypothetical protein
MRLSVLSAVALIGIPISTAAFQAPAAALPVRPTLTEAQKQMLKAAEADFNSKIAPFAEKVSRTTKDLNRVLLDGKADPDLRGRLADDLANRVSELAAEAIRTRVSALGAMVDSLSPEQKKVLLAELDKPGADADLLNVMKKVFKEDGK